MVISLSVAGHSVLELRELLARVAGEPRPVRPAGLEAFAITTCHRVELFGWAEVGGSRDLARVQRELVRWFVADVALQAGVRTAATLRSGEAAARHLVRLASGLESPVLGDRQIGSQIRRAYLAALADGSIGSALDRLAQTAFRAGRRIRRETPLPGADRSIAGQAILAVDARNTTALGGRCLVVGAGAVAEELVEALARRSQDLVVINRSLGRADALARATGARAATWEGLDREAGEAAVIFLATSAPEPVLTRASLPRQRGAEAIVVDLGLPRNAEPGIGTVPGVHLLDLEAIEGQARTRDGDAAAGIVAAEAIVEQELERFTRWLDDGDHRRALVPFRRRLEAVCRREIGFLLGTEVTEHVTRRIVAQLSAQRLARRRARARTDRVHV